MPPYHLELTPQARERLAVHVDELAALLRADSEIRDASFETVGRDDGTTTITIRVVLPS